MARFTELPPEIHLLIAEQFSDQKSFKNLVHLSLTSKEVHHIYQDKFYKTLAQIIKNIQKDADSPTSKGWGKDYSFVEARVPAMMTDINRVAATATRIKKLMGYYGWASGNLAVYFFRVLVLKAGNIRERGGVGQMELQSQGNDRGLLDVLGVLATGIRKAFESQFTRHSGNIHNLDRQLIRQPENDRNWRARLDFLYLSAEKTTCLRTMELIVNVLKGIHLGRNLRWKWAKKVLEKGSKSLFERYVDQGGFMLHTVQHKRRYTSLISLAFKALRKVQAHGLNEDPSKYRKGDKAVWKQEPEEYASVIRWLLDNQCAADVDCQTCADRGYAQCRKFGRITSDTIHGVLLYLFCIEESGDLQILLDQGNDELVIHILSLLTEVLNAAEVDHVLRRPSQYKNALDFTSSTGSGIRETGSRYYLQPLSFVLHNWDRLFDKTGGFSRTALLHALLQKAYPAEFQLNEMVNVVFSPSIFEEDGVESISSSSAEERPISITDKLFFVLPLYNWHCKISSTRDQIRLGQLLLQYGADIHKSTYPITPFPDDTFARVLYRNRMFDILKELLGSTWRECIRYDDASLADHREYVQKQKRRHNKRIRMTRSEEAGFKLVPKVTMEYIYEIHHSDSPHDDHLEMPGYESP